MQTLDHHKLDCQLQVSGIEDWRNSWRIYVGALHCRTVQTTEDVRVNTLAL